MKPSFVHAFISVSVILCLAQVSLADVTIKMKIKEGPNAEQLMTIRFKGRRQRNDFENTPKGGKFAWLYQCDKKQLVGINFTEKRSVVHALDFSSSGAVAFNESQLAPRPPQNPRSGGKLTQTVIVTDTGERRELFGFLARRIKTSTIWDATPSCKQTRLREETDGWYIDLLYGVECSPDLSGFWNLSYLAPHSKCYEHYNKNKYEFHNEQTGGARFGFPLMLTRKVYGDQGKPVINYQEIIELSTATLDASLFEVPAGFTKVDSKTDNRSFFRRLFSFTGK